MSKALHWIVGVSVALLVLAVALSLVWPLFRPQTAWGGYGGMMGPGHMLGAQGMMGMPFGIGMLLWPSLFIGLIILGALWLVRGVAAPGAVRAASTCAHCGKPLEAGWKACPYCGERA